MEEKIQEAQNPAAVETTRKILVVGNHDYILKNVEGLLQKAGYDTAGHTNLEEALDHIRYNTLDAVLIGGGVDPHVRARIASLVSTEFSHLRLIEHFGGPATILSEVQAALKG